MDRLAFHLAFKKYGAEQGKLLGFDYMYNVVFKNIDEPRHILSIGFRRGRMLAAWKQLFPNASVIGMQSDHRVDKMVPEAVSVTRYYADAGQPASLDYIQGQQFDVIVDHVSSNADRQWRVFKNMKDKCTKAYIFENVVGMETDKIIRRRLRHEGFKDSQIVTFGSAVKTVPVTRSSSSEVQQMERLAIVVYM